MLLIPIAMLLELVGLIQHDRFRFPIVSYHPNSLDSLKLIEKMYYNSHKLHYYGKHTIHATYHSKENRKTIFAKTLLF